MSRGSMVRRVTPAGLLLAAVTVAAVVTSSAPAVSRQRAVLPGEAPGWATAGRAVGPASGRLSLSVVLRWRDPAGVDAIGDAVSDPASSSYGDYLTPGAFRSRFGPGADDIALVKRFLSRHGFRVTGVAGAGTLIDATGSVDDAERAFDTKLDTYRYRRDRLRAPAEAVSVPRALSRVVVGVVGLDDSLAKPLASASAPPPPVFRNPPPCSRYWAEKFATDQPTAYGKVQPWVVCGYTPRQLEGAYGVRDEIRRGGDGRGQDVAIVDAFAAPTIRRDVNKYSSRHGLPPVRLTQKTFSGCSRNCTRSNKQGWYGEETLDVEAVHSMAPRAGIHYVGGADATAAKLLHAVAWIVDRRKAQIITNSYGHLGENESRGLIRATEQVHQQAIAEGIGVYYASGDSGDLKGELGFPSATYPASSPHVTSVGGTSLGVGPNHKNVLEVAWGTHRTYRSGNDWDPQPPGPFILGGGGGTSRIFSEPRYQRGVVPTKLVRRFGGHGRVTPDISMDGDPNTGMLVGETQTNPNGQTAYGEYRTGGTSLSSPLFAGYMALADQRAGFDHGFVNPALYRLVGGRSFRDIRPAHSPIAMVRRDYVNFANGQDGRLTGLRTTDLDRSLKARHGYDDATGLGSPYGSRLLRALAR